MVLQSLQSHLVKYFEQIHQTKDHAGYIKRNQKNIENDDEHQTLNNKDEEYILKILFHTK